ncbi:MAG: hypothetical protein JNK81_06845 [Anaerolineales bacterium]|nr:hypothetical protein [Anaerolineales bacterium]
MSRKNKNKFVLFISIFIYTVINGCSQSNSSTTLTLTSTNTPLFTITPSPIGTITHQATVIPTCTPISNGYIYVIDRIVYNSDGLMEFSPSGAIDVLQQALDEHHPDWGQEERLARDTWNYSGAQNIGVNPRVLLVTTGVALDWQIPENHDLKEAIIQTGVVLTQHYREFRFNEELQANYLQVADAANYALYAFFNYDLEKLEVWQQEYDKMFGKIQPRINKEGCY